MTKFTKADIDALVEAMPSNVEVGRSVFIGDTEHTGSWLPHEDVKQCLYLAAGLTATGELKPIKVPGSMSIWRSGAVTFAPKAEHCPSFPDYIVEVRQGYFIPGSIE
jgi:hypothetical protein